MKGVRVIRKYKNRRLYDTEESRHITRGELMDIVRAGRDVQVQEVGTGEDVTSETLLQSILAETGLSRSLIPPEFLMFLIRADSLALHRFFREFLPRSLGAFWEAWERTPAAPFSKAFMDLAGMAHPWAAWGPRRGSEPDGGSLPDEGSLLDEGSLKKRLQRLEDEFEELKKRK